jgi:hypothetical protein
VAREVIAEAQRKFWWMKTNDKQDAQERQAQVDDKRRNA